MHRNLTRGLTKHKLTFEMKQCEKRVPDLIDYFYVYKALLLSSCSFEESNRSRGGAKLAPGPSVRLGPWPKAET